METIAKALEAINAKHRSIMWMIAIHVGISVVGLALLVLTKPWISIAILAANLAAYILVYRRLAKQYRILIDEATLRYGIADGLTDITATAGRSGMTKQEFVDLQLLPVTADPNAVFCLNTFTGKKWGMTLSGSEITIQCPSDSKRIALPSGTLMSAKYDAPARAGDWLVLKNGWLDTGVKAAFLAEAGYRLVEEGDRTSVFSTTEEVMPEYLAKRIRAVMDVYPDAAALRLKPEAAAIYLQDTFYTFRIKAFETPDERALTHNYLKPRDDVWSLFRFWGEGQDA